MKPSKKIINKYDRRIRGFEQLLKNTNNSNQYTRPGSRNITRSS